MHAMEIVYAVDRKAQAIAEVQGTWGDITANMAISFTFEKTAEEDEFLRQYVAWRQRNPLARSDDWK